MRLDDSAREWLALRRDRLRSAASNCDAASRKWNQRNAALTDLAQRSGWDPVRAEQKKAGDPQLRDAFAEWGFFKDEVLRLSADIQAELAYRKLLAMGDDDPTGLRYSREDDADEPAVPVRPHDGFHVTGREPRPTNSPAGFASTERRARRCNPAGGQLSEARGGSTSGMGTAAVRAVAVPTLRGGGLR